MPRKQIEKDLELIYEIDNADVDLPFGVGDWIEDCLNHLEGGEELSSVNRKRAERLLSKFVRRSNDDDND